MFVPSNLRVRVFLALALVGLGSPYLIAAATPTQVSTVDVRGPLPPGSILPFAGSTVPAGYLLCDGSELLRAQYPRLYEALGSAWGSATGFTFTLPDLRGRFLRGVDGAASNDPDHNSRAASGPGGNLGNNVGSVQNDGRRGFSGTFAGTTASAGAHTHPIITRQDDFDEDDGSSSQNFPGWADDSLTGSFHMNDTGSAGAHTHPFNVNVSFSGEAESRPKNAYVNYIIRF